MICNKLSAKFVSQFSNFEFATREGEEGERDGRTWERDAATVPRSLKVWPA